MKFLWFIPTFGDGRYLASARGARDTNLGYVHQIAQAVDELGYYGALLPTGALCRRPMDRRLRAGSAHATDAVFGRDPSGVDVSDDLRAHGRHL